MAKKEVKNEGIKGGGKKGSTMALVMWSRN